MKDFPLSILEGLIHNIRTPLNLILGYAQQLQKQGDNAYLERILQAGVTIDDLLQSTWEAFDMRKAEVCQLNLNEWLGAEMALLHNHLMIKHKLLMVADIPKEEVYCLVSPLMLSQWLESTLLCIVGGISNCHLQAKFQILANAKIIIELICQDADYSSLISLAQQCKDNSPEFIKMNTSYNGAAIMLEVSII